jgi:hypothetical protein
MNLARTDDEGRIVELTVFVRPLPACLATPLAFAFRTADRLAPRCL